MFKVEFEDLHFFLYFALAFTCNSLFYFQFLIAEAISKARPTVDELTFVLWTSHAVWEWSSLWLWL